MIVDNDWVDPKEVRELFSKPSKPIEVDDELGLAIKKTETIESKYGISGIKDNSFTRSLRQQFSKKGYLSEKQLQCLR